MAIKELKVLDQKLYMITQAVADTLAPTGGAFQVGAQDVDAALLFDNYIDRLGKLPLKLIKTVLYLLEYAPLFTRLKRFSRMNQEQRLNYLRGWENSRIASKRNLFVMIKMLILMPFYSHDAVANAMNYHPECLIKDEDTHAVYLQ